ncbi:MAG: hypothetical protein HKO13_01040 [Sphingomonas sp.]|nr:hypothetical protein [Sphingomonas sp.]RZV51697.1 MAG: hypothetical protein EX258_03350 [Sphingomonadaceae bacterium]
MNMIFSLAAAVLLANPSIGVDPKGYGTDQNENGYNAIEAGDLEAAEMAIMASGREDAAAKLNLAYIYAKTDRQAEAGALLRDVLSEDAVDLEAMSGNVHSSHAVAATLMQRLGDAGSRAASVD